LIKRIRNNKTRRFTFGFFIACTKRKAHSGGEGLFNQISGNKKVCYAAINTDVSIFCNQQKCIFVGHLQRFKAYNNV